MTATPGRCSLRLTRHLEAAPDEVWRALSQPESQRRWLGSGFEVEVRTLEQGRALELRLTDSVARIELRAENGGTLLVLDHVDIEATLGMRTLQAWTVAFSRFEEEL